MIKIVMSPEASALLRGLIDRSHESADRILLIEVHSTDWRSLTFTGERHQIELRVPAPGSRGIVERLCRGSRMRSSASPASSLPTSRSWERPSGRSMVRTASRSEALTIEAD